MLKLHDVFFARATAAALAMSIPLLLGGCDWVDKTASPDLSPVTPNRVA